MNQMKRVLCAGLLLCIQSLHAAYDPMARLPDEPTIEDVYQCVGDDTGWVTIAHITTIEQKTAVLRFLHQIAFSEKLIIKGFEQRNDARDHAIAALGLMTDDEPAMVEIGKVIDSGDTYLRGRAVLAYAQIAARRGVAGEAVRKLSPLLDSTPPREWGDLRDAWGALNDKSAVEVAVAKIAACEQRLPDDPTRRNEDGTIWPSNEVYDLFQALGLLQWMKIPEAKKVATAAILRLKARYGSQTVWNLIEKPLKDFVSPDVYAVLEPTPEPPWSATQSEPRKPQPDGNEAKEEQASSVGNVNPSPSNSLSNWTTYGAISGIAALLVIVALNLKRRS